MLKGILKVSSSVGDAAVCLNKKSTSFQEIVTVADSRTVKVMPNEGEASKVEPKYVIELNRETADLKPPQETIKAPAQTSFIGSLFQNKNKKKEITYFGDLGSKKEKARIARLEKHKDQAIERGNKLTKRLATNVAAVHDDKPDRDVLYSPNAYEAILDKAFEYEKKREARELRKQFADLTWDE